jgi:alkanesulfonate monooxygenase SsuD/methylene tetrahydromethanopterin reductase-like flavin-dependent oxidoreductase (luciferase family)
MARMGHEEASLRIQDLFLAGRRDEAVAAVPDSFVDEISLVGPPERIRDRLAAWRGSVVTTLLVGAHTREELRQVAEIVLSG